MDIMGLSPKMVYFKCLISPKAITLRSDNATNFTVAITVQNDNRYPCGQSDNDKKR